MAEDKGTQITPATIPNNENWAKWTIEQAIQAITGDSVDLTKLIDKKWFTFVPEGAGKTWTFKSGADKPDLKGEMSYHVYGKQYYGANIDHQAIATWQDGYDKFVKVGPDLANGIAGEMDASKLNTLRDKIVELQRFLDDRGSQYRQWAKLLDSNAADFSGKAAAVIQSRMDAYADTLEQWAKQLRYNYTKPLVDAVAAAAAALNVFNVAASKGIDFMEANKFRDLVQNAVNDKIAEIYRHLNFWGLVHSDPRYYFLDQTQRDEFLEDTWNRIMEQARLWYMAVAGRTDAGWVDYKWQMYESEKKFREWVDWYVGEVMFHFRTGDLRTEAAWDKLNKEVTATALLALFGADAYTRWAIEDVHDKYQILGRAFHALDQAKSPHTSQFGPNGMGGFPNSLFPNGMFDHMFPNNMFEGMFPNNMFGNLFPDNMFGNLFPDNMFGNLFPDNMFDKNSPNGFPLGGGPNSYDNPYGNTPGSPNMDGFGGNPYSAYQNIPPYPEMPNYGGSPSDQSPYGQSPYGNYSPGDLGYGPGQGPFDQSPYGNYAPPEFSPGDYGPGMGNYSPGGLGYEPGLGPGGYGNLSPGELGPGAYAPGNLSPGDYSPGDYAPGDFGPGGYGPGALPSFPGADIGPHGEKLGPDGEPELGPHGELMGPDNSPVLGPYGQILGPDGQSLLGPNGELLGPDGGSLLGPQGQILGPDGQSLLGPNGELLGPDGQPVLGTDGKPILGTPPAFDPGQYVPGGAGAFDPGQFQPGGLPGGGSSLPGGTGGLGPGAGSFDPGQFLDPGSIDPATFTPPQSRLDLPLDAYKSALQPPAYQSGLGAQLDSNGLAIPSGGASAAGGLSGSPSSAAGPGGAGMAGMGGMGGMPFIPPMGGMGGMGGPGKKEERERQTWLSEDEEVWGTSVAVGAGVIGRPDEDEDEFDPDELVLPAGPVRTPRPGTPVPARAGTETGRDPAEAGGEDRRDDAATQRS